MVGDSATASGSRSGGVLPGGGELGSPPKPPSPRAKIVNRLVNRGSPGGPDSTSMVTSAAFPLS